MSKLRMPKPISHAVGPVYTVNDPIKFSNGGGRKMKPAKPMEDSSGAGGTRPNKTLIPTMNADVPPKTSKVMGTKKWFDPYKKGEGTNATNGDTVAGTTGDLKSSYEK